MSHSGSGLQSKNLTKGAFILIDKSPKIIQFQFNPETLKRDLALSEASDGSSTSGQETQGIGNDLLTDQWLGETISFDLMLDAKENPMKIDAKENPWKLDAEGNPVNEGVLPILSAIEELMQPEISVLQRTSVEHKNPSKELRQVIFVWGKSRRLPVKIESLSVEESEFSYDLYPIRAKVSISMKMLNPKITKGVSQKMKYAFQWTIDNRTTSSTFYHTHTKNDKAGISQAYEDLSERT